MFQTTNQKNITRKQDNIKEHQETLEHTISHENKLKQIKATSHTLKHIKFAVPNLLFHPLDSAVLGLGWQV